MNSEPFGYLITFRTYGTWLHGDSRGSVDSDHRAYGTNLLPPNRAWEREAARKLDGKPVTLNTAGRVVVERTVAEVCAAKEWTLHAVHARTNHVHVVASAPEPPERLLNTLKSWCTRRLRESDCPVGVKRIWSRHGSTQYLWNDQALREACRYAMESQGEALL